MRREQMRREADEGAWAERQRAEEAYEFGSPHDQGFEHGSQSQDWRYEQEQRFSRPYGREQGRDEEYRPVETYGRPYTERGHDWEEPGQYPGERLNAGRISMEKITGGTNEVPPGKASSMSGHVIAGAVLIANKKTMESLKGTPTSTRTSSAENIAR